MNKKILIIAIIIILVTSLFFIINNWRNNAGNNNLSKAVQCLADAGVVIYGSKTCPACASLIDDLGGYEIVESIYIECTENKERCTSEMQTNYVPEIQIKGEFYSGPITLDSIGDAVNCEI